MKNIIVSVAEFGETEKIRNALRKSDNVRNTCLDLLYNIPNMKEQNPETRCFIYDQIHNTAIKYA